jgi:hypothetical protein
MEQFKEGWYQFFFKGLIEFSWQTFSIKGHVVSILTFQATQWFLQSCKKCKNHLWIIENSIIQIWPEGCSLLISDRVVEDICHKPASWGPSLPR